MKRYDQRSASRIAWLHHCPAVVVADALAGTDQVAAGGDDAVRVSHLTADRCRRGLVQEAHSLRNIALTDCGETKGRLSQHLQINFAQRPGQGARLGAEPSRGNGIVVEDDRDVAFQIASMACSGQGSIPSRRWWARWNQPSPTACSPRRA